MDLVIRVPFVRPIGVSRHPVEDKRLYGLSEGPVGFPFLDPALREYDIIAYRVGFQGRRLIGGELGMRSKDPGTHVRTVSLEVVIVVISIALLLICNRRNDASPT